MQNIVIFHRRFTYEYCHTFVFIVTINIHSQTDQSAQSADTRFNGLPEDRTDAGPVARELAKCKVIGLAVGAYGEVSESVHRD